MLTASFCAPWGGGGAVEDGGDFQMAPEQAWPQNVLPEYEKALLGPFFFSILTRAVSRNVGETGTKTRSLTEVKLQGGLECTYL